MSETSTINPPSWIIGTWSGSYTDSNLGVSLGLSFQFTNNNVIIASTYGTMTSDLNATTIADNTLCFSEISNSTLYQMTTSDSDDAIVGGILKFIKTSDTTLTYTETYDGNTYMIVYLTKE